MTEQRIILSDSMSRLYFITSNLMNRNPIQQDDGCNLYDIMKNNTLLMEIMPGEEDAAVKTIKTTGFENATIRFWGKSEEILASVDIIAKQLGKTAREYR